MTISDHTKIEWKTVIWMLSAAVSYGIMFQQLQQARQDIAVQGERIESQGKVLAEIKAIVTNDHPLAKY